MTGYKSKYIKTYIWSGLSMILNFLSMFIVAPLTTSMPEAYGVYSLCISFNIFLRYADMGFINAGRKYAAEAFSVNNYVMEKKYVGTSIFIYGSMATLLFVLALLLSSYPELVLKDINNSPYYNLAQQLLLILAFTFPLSIIQRFCSLIYSVRIEEYKIQSYQIFGSVIKIVSVPLYFFNNRYDLVGYYLFCESINLITNLIILWDSRNIGYGYKEFGRCLKIDKKVFHEIKPLALAGFTSVIGWVTYYELDVLGVSLLIGANAVAIYAIGKQMQNVIRSLINLVFSPYPVRINYFVGQKDFNGLRTFYYKLVEELSFILIPVITIVFFAKPFVISWVGEDYEDSCIILQLLVMTFIYHHITSQGVTVIYGLNKVKDIMRLAVLQPLLLWGGIFATYKFLGLCSFAILNFVSTAIFGFYTFFLLRKYLLYSVREFYWHLFAKPILIICLSCGVFWYFASPLLTMVHKGHHDLLLVVSLIFACCIFSFAIFLCFNNSLRKEIKGVLKFVNKW